MDFSKCHSTMQNVFDMVENINDKCADIAIGSEGNFVLEK